MRHSIVIFSLFILISSTLLLSACTKPEAMVSEPKELTVAATIFPLYDILRQVGGEKVEAILLLPPGASPHTFEPTPEQVKQLENTDILLSIGAELDDWALALSANTKNAKILSLDEVIALRAYEDHAGEIHEGEEEEHGEFDPHYWLDPNNARLMAVYIATILGEQNPENTDYYQARAQEFSLSLSAKEQVWQSKIDSLNNKNLLIFHDAWHYFAEHFSLNIVASIEAFPGQSPSPQYLQELQTTIQSGNVKAIFIEPQLSATVASALADDLQIKIATLDPLGGANGRETYIDLIDYNVTSIVDTLSD